MTIINYKKKDNLFEIISIRGHAKFAKRGNDIVCSGISSIVYGSIAFFNKKYKNSILIEEKNSEFTFIPKEKNFEIQICLEMMFYQLKNISNFYPKNLSFEEN